MSLNSPAVLTNPAVDVNSNHKKKDLIRGKHIRCDNSSCFTDHSGAAVTTYDLEDGEFEDALKRTSMLVLDDSSVHSGSSEHNDAFSYSASSILKTPISGGPGFFSSPILESSRVVERSLGVGHSHSILRHRRFGSSSVVQSARPNLSKIIKTRKISPKMKVVKACRKNCKIFSTCVTPCPSPALISRSSVFRVSGISMSPSTPISWRTQSPIELDSVTSFPSAGSRNSPLSTPTQSASSQIVSASSSPSKSSKTSSQRLQVSDDSCPPDKFYFWNDDWSELVADEQLGRGGFGQVFEGTYRGKRVAIKKLKTAFQQKKAAFENFVGEIMSLRLSHPNLVRSLVLVQPPNSPLTPGSKDTSYLVMELAGERNLLQVLNSEEEISQKMQIGFNLDILQGLSYLHNRGIAHLDLKPSNVIVTSDNLCKICDFGSCKLVEMSSLSNEAHAFSSVNQSYCSSASSVGDCRTSGASSSGRRKETSSLLMGTLYYRAPELLKGMEPTLKADIFSFGVTSWQIKQRVNPYPNVHPHSAVFMIVASRKRPAIPDYEEIIDGLDQQYFKIVESCWSDPPADRPPVYEVLNEFFEMKDCLNCNL